MTQCPDDMIQALVAAIGGDPQQALTLIDHHLEEWPQDGRLHFLRASMLAGQQRPIEAHHAFTRAVALAPDLAIARFQLGFFELTSGEAARAIETLLPLEAMLPEGHYLRLFATGLQLLIEDRFAETIETLTNGIGANHDNLPLNGDMQLIIDRCRDVMSTAEPESSSAGATSSTSFLLGQLGGTTH